MWTAILLVVMTSGQIYTDSATMDEVGMENTEVSCKAFIADADARFQKIQNPEVSYYKLACIQE